MRRPAGMTWTLLSGLRALVVHEGHQGRQVEGIGAMVDDERLRDAALRVGLHVGSGPPVRDDGDRVGPVLDLYVGDHDQPIAERWILGKEEEDSSLLRDHDPTPALLPAGLLLQRQGDRSAARRKRRHLEPGVSQDQALQPEGAGLNGGVGERWAEQGLLGRDRYHYPATGGLGRGGGDHCAAPRKLMNAGASHCEQQETGGNREQACPPVHVRRVHLQSEDQTPRMPDGPRMGAARVAVSVPAAIIASGCGGMTFSRPSGTLRWSASSACPRSPVCACGPSWRGRTRQDRSRTGSRWPWWRRGGDTSSPR